MIQCQAIARQDELQGNLSPAKQYKDIGTFSHCCKSAQRATEIRNPRTTSSSFLGFALQGKWCSARNRMFSLIARWLLPFLQAFSSTEVLDVILMKLRTPSPSYTLDSWRLVSRKRYSPDEIQSSCTILAGQTAQMPPKSESLPQPNWKCVNIPPQKGHATVETVPNTMEKKSTKGHRTRGQTQFFHLADMEIEVFQSFSANKLIHQHGQSFKRGVQSSAIFTWLQNCTYILCC